MNCRFGRCRYRVVDKIPCYCCDCAIVVINPPAAAVCGRVVDKIACDGGYCATVDVNPPAAATGRVVYKITCDTFYFCI